MRIVIVGGAFNPPTLAHIELAKEAKKQVNADLAILIPSKLSYMQSWKKYQNSDIYRDDIRKEAVLACECEWLKADTCEMDGLVSGKTYDAIQYIKNKYHTVDVYFAIGSDKLEEITRWAEAKELLSSEKFIVMQRNNDDIGSIIRSNESLSEHTSSFVRCEAIEKYQNYSSTLVRKYLTSENNEEQEKVKGMVPLSVWNILKRNYVI